MALWENTQLGTEVAPKQKVCSTEYIQFQGRRDDYCSDGERPVLWVLESSVSKSAKTQKLSWVTLLHSDKG